MGLRDASASKNGWRLYFYITTYVCVSFSWSLAPHTQMLILYLSIWGIMVAKYKWNMKFVQPGELALHNQRAFIKSLMKVISRKVGKSVGGKDLWKCFLREMFIVLRAWGGGGGGGNVIGCFPFPQQGGVMVEVFTNIEGVKILMSVTLTRIFTMLITVSSNTMYIYYYTIYWSVTLVRRKVIFYASRVIFNYKQGIILLILL